MLRYAGMAAALFVATAALAQDHAMQPQPWFDATLAQVRPGAAPHFYWSLYGDGKFHDKCPAITAVCLRPAHLVAGDVVLAGETRGKLVHATFVNARGQETEGWLDRTAIQPAPATAPSLSAWNGHWQHAEPGAEGYLDIAATPRGAIAFSGEALWIDLDSKGVKTGNVHVGDIEGTATLAGDRIGPADGDTGGCKVAMRLTGPYLIVTDNLACGGVHVTFAGTYRRTGPAKAG